MTVDLAEIARIRLEHRQADGLFPPVCSSCSTGDPEIGWPCDTAKVLAALDEEIGANVGAVNEKRRRRAKRRGR